MRYWGWGALRVDTPPKGWVCPLCGWKVKNREPLDGRHWYPFSVACSSCARSAFLAELLTRFG